MAGAKSDNFVWIREEGHNLCKAIMCSSTKRTNSYRTMACWGLSLTFLLSLPCCSLALREPIRYNLTEERASGSFVGNVLMDGGFSTKYNPRDLESLRFELYKPDEQTKGLFSIDESTGVLRVAGRIDRDVLCPAADTCILNVDVQVMPPMYFELIKISINILDLNDHVPAFPADTIKLKLSEASVVGTSLAVSLPTDPDSPKFGVNHYKLISSSNTFELQVPEDPESLEDIYLVLREALDREQQDSYMLQVVAFDGGDPPQWGSVMVNISIIDVNDNTPTFVKDSYETSVPENSPVGTVVLRVIADDPDAGEQGRVVYVFSQKTLSSYKDTFRINATTGEITAIGPLDYEEKNLYKLSVIARDNSTQALSSQTLVTIHVTDQNDHPPQIKINPQNTSNLIISENYTPGDFVAHISVVDLDDGDNGQFNCTLDSQFFGLQKLYETEFKLITTKDLDREIHDKFLLAIICTDKGSPPLTSRLNLLVQISDENDNAPIFDSDMYVFNVTEGSPAGTKVGRVSATDADTGDNGKITYQLTDDTNGAFHIDPKTGELLTLAVFDHEEVSRVNFTVIAKDGAVPEHKSNVSVLVNILDTDDEPLQFTLSHYVFSVTENSARKSYIGTVVATDIDTILHNVTYTFVSKESPENHPFHLNSSSGIITLTGSLNHEHKKVYNLTVGVSATGSSSILATSLVSIIVGDLNDNKPYFVFPTSDNYTVYTGEVVESGDIITQVLVSDEDSGQNGRVGFFIKEGNGSEHFSIGRDSGVIVSDDDINEIGAIYELIIVAYDYGTPRFTTEARLEIHVGVAVPGSLTSLPGGNQTIVIVIATVCGVIAVILIVAIAIIIKRQCCGRRRNNHHKELIVKFSADNPVCTPSPITEDSMDKKGDSFSSHDSGNESSSCKEVETSSSCSPSSSIEHESDVEDIVAGSIEENNRPLFLQIPNTDGTLLNPVRLDKDSDSGSNTTDSGRGSSSSQSDGFLHIDMTPDPCFYTEGSQWPQSSGLLLQPVSVSEMQRQMCAGVQRSHSYLGSLTPSTLQQHTRPRRPASFLYPPNKLANPSHLTRQAYCAPVSAGCGGRIPQHTPSFSSDPQTNPGQYYQPDTGLRCSQSNGFTNKGEDHLTHYNSSLAHLPSQSPYWDVPVFDLQAHVSQTSSGSLSRRAQKGILSSSLDSKSLEASIPKESGSSILKDASSAESSNKHGNHVRFKLPEEETQEEEVPVVTLTTQPAKRVYLCSEV